MAVMLPLLRQVFKCGHRMFVCMCTCMSQCEDENEFMFLSHTNETMQSGENTLWPIDLVLIMTLQMKWFGWTWIRYLTFLNLRFFICKWNYQLTLPTSNKNTQRGGQSYMKKNFSGFQVASFNFYQHFRLFLIGWTVR